MTSLTSFLIAAVFLLSENTLRFFIYWDFKASPLSLPRLILHSLLSLLPLLAFCLKQLYLPAFFLLFLAANCVQERLVFLSGGYIDRLLRIRFSVFGSLLLFCIGIGTVFTSFTLNDILSHPTYIVNSLSIATLLYMVLKLSLLFRKTPTGIVIHDTQQKDFRYLYSFLNLDACYIFLQSVFCLFHTDLTISFSFFLCGNIIFIILIFTFLYSLYQIRASHHTEQHNAQLSASLRKGQRQLTSLMNAVHFDGLTGAHSRLFLIQESTRLMDFQIPFALVYMDLNGLKKVNDTHGHVAGDKYLKEFTNHMKLHIRQEDTFARFGGDEFILLMPHCDKAAASERISNIAECFSSEGYCYPFAFGCSDTTESLTLEELITMADKRMYQNKIENRGLRRA